MRFCNLFFISGVQYPYDLNPIMLSRGRIAVTHLDFTPKQRPRFSGNNTNEKYKRNPMDIKKINKFMAVVSKMILAPVGYLRVG